MTGGWAATNTLREIVEEFTEDMPHRSHRVDGRGALVLVETVLDAFEEWGYQRRRFIDGETDIVTLRDAEANALAALRAVREGK